MLPWETEKVSSTVFLGRREKTFEQSSSTIAKKPKSEPEPVPYVLQGEDIQALEIKVEDLQKVCMSIFTARNSCLN